MKEIDYYKRFKKMTWGELSQVVPKSEEEQEALLKVKVRWYLARG